MQIVLEDDDKFGGIELTSDEEQIANQVIRLTWGNSPFVLRVAGTLTYTSI